MRDRRAAAPRAWRRAASGRCATPGTATTENFYSAWIEKLFDAPFDDAPSWKALHEVLRDRSRNVLFNYLGLREDEIGMIVRPDCADLPYFLRAYFAFKMGLPFGYSKCSRGGGGQPPKCGAWFNIQIRGRRARRRPKAPRAEPPPGAVRRRRPPAAPPAPRPAGDARAEAARACRLVRQYAARPPATRAFRHRARADDDDNTDYLSGAADGSRRCARARSTPIRMATCWCWRGAWRRPRDAAGRLLAVDGQPDGTVARKRYWRGNFLFAQDPALGSPGFKRFRPIVREKSGALRRLTNAEIAKNPQYGDFSLEQSKLAVEEFYDRMDDVMSPTPLDPVRAIKDAITSLEEQVKTRVTSVENGRKFRPPGAATPTCRTARRSSRPTAPGRISPRRRAICAC